MDWLTDFLANSDCSGVPYEKLATLISLIANKIVNENVIVNLNDNKLLI